MKKKLLIAALGLLVAIVVGAYWYVVHTNVGINFVLARIATLKSVRIVADDVKGTLAGPLTIKHLLIDHKLVHVEADDIVLQLSPSAALFGSIQIDGATVARVSVDVKKVPDEPTTTPLRFLPGFLSLSADNIDVHNAHVVVYESIVQNAERARGRVRLSSGRLRVFDAEVDAAPSSATGEVIVRARRPIELEVDAHLKSPAPRGPQFEAAVGLKGPVDKLELAVKLTAPSEAQLQGQIARTGTVWRLTGQVESRQFAFDPWLQRPPFDLRDLSAKIDATTEDIHISGGVTVPEVDPAPLQLDFHGQYAGRVIAVTHGEIRPTKSDMAVITAARIDMSAGRPVIAATAQWSNLRWPIRENFFLSPEGQVSLAGSLPFDIGINAGLKTEQNISGHLLAHGKLSDADIEFDEATLNVLDGEVKGAARLNFSQTHEWRVALTGRDIDPRTINAQLPGRLAFKVEGSGAGLDRKADFALTMPSLSGTLRGDPLQGHGFLSHDANGWNAKELVLTLGANRLTANGEWRQRIDLAWSLEVPALEKFLGDASGTLRFQGTAHGTQKRPQIAGSLYASKIKYGDWNAAEISLAGNVDLSDQLVSQLRLDASKIGWRDIYLDTLRSRGQGKAGGHTLEVRGVTTKNGAFTKITAKLEGNYTNGIWQARIAPVEFADGAGDDPTIQAPGGQLLWSDKNRFAHDLCLLWTTHKFCGNADWAPHGAWRAEVKSDLLPLNVFNGSFPQRSKYQGGWVVQGKFSGDEKTPWIGEANIDINNASIAYQAIEGADELARLGTGKVTLIVGSDRYSADVRIVTPGSSNIQAAAHVARNTEVEFGNSALNGELHVSTGEANLLPIVFPDLDRSAGDLTIEMTANGTPSSPLFQGRIDLQKGEVDLYRYNLSMREFGVSARIADNRLAFDGQGHMGTGQFAMSGNLGWRGLDPVGTLHLQGENLLVANLLDYKVTASPKVDFKIDGKRVDATGEVTIPSAHIEPKDLRGAVQISRDARLVGEIPEPPLRGFDVHSEIRVTVGQDVRLETFGLQGKLGGAVVIATNGRNSTGRGELNVSDGRYEAYGQKLDIARGRLLFDASPIEDPGLDIQAARQIEDTRVGVNVRGTLKAPRVSLFSEPGLPQTQIVSMLLTGKPIADLSSRDAAAVGAAQPDLRVQGGSVLASQIGRRLGLEDVSLESTGLNDTALVLGKFLSPRLFVSYGISLTESINTLKLRYTISKKWRAKAEAGQNQSADLEYRIER